MSDITTVQKINSDRLLKKVGVQGTAVGEKWSDGKPTGEPAIIIFVQKKYSESTISNPNVLKAYHASDLIPKEIDGIPTDVIEVGYLQKQTGFRNKSRPLKPGFSCGHKDITAGTIGGFFLDSKDRPVLLSNNHVIANENKAKIGDPIYQPGPADCRSSKSNIIGTLAKYVKLKKNNNVQDSAVAYLNDTILDNLDDLYPEMNMRLNGFGQATLGQTVQKCGRTTGYTTGRVLGLNASFNIAYDMGMANFQNCIVFTAMSQGGDSGSIIQDNNNNAVALLFAGSPKVTIANPFDLVAAEYGLKLFSQEYNSKIPTNGIDKSWKILHDKGSEVKIDNNTVYFTAKKNQYCCIQHPIGDFKQIRCTVYTGDDIAAAWAPGLTVFWPNGFIKLNIRHGGSFGGYSHLDRNFSIGTAKPNKHYQLRILNNNNVYVGQIKDNNQWYNIIEVPKNILSNKPSLIRIGKTNINGELSNHRILGTKGQSHISELIIK